MLARVLAVPEIFDAMVDGRPWRGGLGVSRARSLIHEQSGSLFDPRVAEAFMAIPEQEIILYLSGEAVVETERLRSAPSHP